MALSTSKFWLLYTWGIAAIAIGCYAALQYYNFRGAFPPSADPTNYNVDDILFLFAKGKGFADAASIVATFIVVSIVGLVCYVTLATCFWCWTCCWFAYFLAMGMLLVFQLVFLGRMMFTPEITDLLLFIFDEAISNYTASVTGTRYGFEI